jgi:hypothetical protein
MGGPGKGGNARLNRQARRSLHRKEKGERRQEGETAE